jgi:hypothetical protein
MLVFFLIGLIDNVRFQLLYMNQLDSEGNIVDHISAKRKSVCYYLQCCVIGTSNSLVTMQLIEGSNQTDYLFVILELHDYFPNQMI